MLSRRVFQNNIYHIYSPKIDNINVNSHLYMLSCYLGGSKYHDIMYGKPLTKVFDYIIKGDPRIFLIGVIKFLIKEGLNNFWKCHQVDDDKGVWEYTLKWWQLMTRRVGGIFETPKYDDVIWAQPIMSLDNITVQPHTQLNELFKYEI